jgi:hypothetical protein
MPCALWESSSVRVPKVFDQILTFLNSFVRFLAFAITAPSRTNAQPTGTSPASMASPASTDISDTYPIACADSSRYHFYGDSHPLYVFFLLIFWPDIYRHFWSED